MAIFASTTTSGYSDPLKAMNIKALEQRLKDQQAQMAAQQPDAASMATIPGGIGHVLGVVGDRMAQARGEQALASQRDVLAKAVSGYDPASGAPPPAAIATVDPAMYKDMLQTWAENRRAQQQNETQKYGYDSTARTATAGHEVTRSGNQLQADVSREGHGNQAAMETARLEAAKAAAAEAARVAEIKLGQEDTAIRAREAQKVLDAEVAADAQEKRLAGRAQDEVTKVEQDFTNGKITREQADARINKLTSKPASEEKLIIEERNKAVGYQSDLKQLDRAHEIIHSPEGIHSGNALMTPLKTGIGSIVPQSLGGPNDKTQANTMEFNRIMKSQGLQNLLAMKGASSDKDVTLNLEIANDPKEPLERRKNALNIARNKLYTIAEANKADVERIGGQYPRLQAAPGGEDKNAAARAWLADPANKGNPDYEAVRRKVEGK